MISSTKIRAEFSINNFNDLTGLPQNVANNTTVSNSLGYGLANMMVGMPRRPVRVSRQDRTPPVRASTCSFPISLWSPTS